MRKMFEIYPKVIKKYIRLVGCDWKGDAFIIFQRERGR